MNLTDTTDWADLAIEQLKEAECAAYARGDKVLANLIDHFITLRQKVSDLENDVEEAEKLEDWNIQYGDADHYLAFFKRVCRTIGVHSPSRIDVSDRVFTDAVFEQISAEKLQDWEKENGDTANYVAFFAQVTSAANLTVTIDDSTAAQCAIDALRAQVGV